MSNKSIWKLDNDTVYPTNCFPAHGTSRRRNEGTGSWVVAYAEEQVEKLQSLFKSKNQLFQSSNNENYKEKNHDKERNNTLDAEYLMQRHHVDNPTDLCSVNVVDRNLNLTKEEEFLQFKNVAYVNAAENFLPLRPFSNFVSIRELELPVNGIKNIQLDFKDFPNLQVLDLSYNHLDAKDVLALGVLQNLKVLTLTGNDLLSIHQDMAKPEIVLFDNGENKVIPRFGKLEVLYLDNNKLSDLSTFASLAALPQLRELNLDNNGIEVIPHLKVVGDRVVSETHSSMGHHISVASSGKKSRMSQKVESEKPTDAITEGFHAQEDEDRKFSPISNGLSETGSIPNPPFENLRLLSVSNNLIREEECVLAVAAWPSLGHLVICNNPLVDSTKGEPPLLSHYLRERLGVNIHRFEKNTALPKPHLIIPFEKDRKVGNRIPKIPKQPVDVLINSLMAPEINQSLDGSVSSEINNDSLPLKEEISDKEQVFLTQLDEEVAPKQEQPATKKKREVRNKQFSPVHTSNGENKFKDYEVLLDVRENECPLEDAGIQGNVKILNEMMKHPTLLRPTNHVQVNRRPPVARKSTSKDREVMIADQEQKQIEAAPKKKQLSQHLLRLRSRPVIDIELPLSTALQSAKNKQLSDEAEALLEEVEQKYRIVREESIKTSENIKSVLEESKKMIQGLSE